MRVNFRRKEVIRLLTKMLWQSLTLHNNKFKSESKVLLYNNEYNWLHVTLATVKWRLLPIIILNITYTIHLFEISILNNVKFTHAFNCTHTLSLSLSYINYMLHFSPCFSFLNRKNKWLLCISLSSFSIDKS